jgi:hypothetical protein
MPSLSRYVSRILAPSCAEDRPGADTGIVIRCEKTPSAMTLAEWDELVERSTGTDVTQLSAWATVRADAGYAPVYLFAYAGHTIVGGALVLCRRLFGVLPVAYLPYGPLVDRAAREPHLVTAGLVDALTRLARSSALTFIQPPEGANPVSDALLARGFRESHAGIAPAGSYRLDLTPPLEIIRSGFSKRLKSWTNRWEAKGVRVRQGDEKDLPVLVELMAHTGARQGFTPPTLQQLNLGYRALDFGGLPERMLADMIDRGVRASDDWPAAHRGKLAFNGVAFRYPMAVEMVRPAPVRWAYDFATRHRQGQRLIAAAKHLLRTTPSSRTLLRTRRSAGSAQRELAT